MIRKILVYTFGDQSHDQTIETAARFAAEQKAQLVGLFVRPDMMIYASVYGNYPLNLAQNFYDLQGDFAKKIKSRFDKITGAYDIQCEWHDVEQQERNPNPALYADYIFVSQPDAKSSVIFDDADFVDHLITDTGVPTIIIPQGWSKERFAQLPALGWKECREAAGAVRHALPLMQSAKNVDIVTINKRSNANDELIQGIEISEYLTARGVTTQFFSERVTGPDENETDALLRHVKNQGRDLIIVGGYGHSRFREIILGGMTRALIKNSTVPVLLSH
jgi:nucleotide-binding universal stress UspA family protein